MPIDNSPMGILNYIKNLLGLASKPSTAGPAEDEHPLIPAVDYMKAAYKAGKFVDGWWSEADKTEAHPGRVGGYIVPKTLVVHTTDMYHSSWQALINAWQSKAADGACAHFLIGRDNKQGIKQMMPITRNGNHAGGKIHGNYRNIKTGALLHPNVVAIGVEIHAAGRLKRTSKGWLHTDSGLIVPPEETYTDKLGRTWGLVTDYQLEVLGELITALDLPGMPDWEAVPDGDYKENVVADYAPVTSCKVVGHVTLDPVNRNDPGSQVMDWLREKGFVK